MGPSLVRIFFAVLSTLVAFSPTYAFSQGLDEQLGKSACYGALLGTLTSWSPEYHWTRQPDTDSFTAISMSPIAPTGSFVWVGLNTKTKVLEARSTTPESRMQMDWIDPDCTPHAEIFSGSKTTAPRDKNAFDDEELSQLLATTPQGVIFAYSDRMHLSMDEKLIVQKVADALKIPLTILADPESPTMSGKKLGSNELIGRGMTLHYPSIVVYSHGKITSPMMPGYKSERIYTQFIDEYLK